MPAREGHTQRLVARLSPLYRRQFVPVQQVLDAFHDAPDIDAERFFADTDGRDPPAQRGAMRPRAPSGGVPT